MRLTFHSFSSKTSNSSLRFIKNDSASFIAFMTSASSILAEFFLAFPPKIKRSPQNVDFFRSQFYVYVWRRNEARKKIEQLKVEDTKVKKKNSHEYPQSTYTVWRLHNEILFIFLVLFFILLIVAMLCWLNKTKWIAN